MGVWINDARDERERFGVDGFSRFEILQLP
jgi:hypothetical protein